MKKFVVYLFIVITLIDCNSKKTNKFYQQRFSYEETFGDTAIKEVRVVKDHVKQVVIPEDIEEHALRIDTIFRRIKFIQLETNDNCLISHLDKILFIDDKLIVADKMKEEKAYLFSENGKFIRQVGIKGKGPGEYVSLRDIAIDSENNQIVIFDGKGRKLLYYTENGNLIKTKKTFYYSDNMAILNKNCFVYHQLKGQNLHLPDIADYQLILSDSSQKIIRKAFSYNSPDVKRKLNLNSIYNLNVVGSKLLFNPRFTNDIYEISDPFQVTLKYEIILGSKDILNHITKYNSTDEYLNKLNRSRLWRYEGPAIEAGDWLYGKITNAGLFFFNKKTNKLLYGNGIGILSKSTDNIRNTSNEKKLIFNYYLYQNIIASEDSFFVSYVWPENLFNQGNTNSVMKFQELKNPVKYYDNPVLVFFILKM